jgi:hypothetical protein
MEQKKFEKGSKFEKYDLDGDGIISDEEMSQAEKLHEIEQEDLKAKAEVRKMAAQRRMAWIALASMIIFTVILMFPIIPDDKSQTIRRSFQSVLCSNGWCCWRLHGNDSVYVQKIILIYTSSFQVYNYLYGLL